MWKLLFIVLFFLIISKTNAQSTYFPLDTLSNNDIVLKSINFRYGHTYQFKTRISEDSIFLILPPNLPKGYFEAYYNNDTNKLALVYYNSGSQTYGQQFYINNGMKSDTEYNRVGVLHGLHVLYDKKGEEVWHAEYNFGVLDKRYDLTYLEQENKTALLLKNKSAFGWYEFTPTPSRGRQDKIHLKEDYTFVYEYSTNTCIYCNSSNGTWQAIDNYIILKLNNKTLWRANPRKFAIATNPKQTRLELIEIKDWGVEWYNSEYLKIKN